MRERKGSTPDEAPSATPTHLLDPAELMETRTAAAKTQTAAAALTAGVPIPPAAWPLVPRDVATPRVVVIGTPPATPRGG
jgi:hypothetical protein